MQRPLQTQAAPFIRCQHQLKQPAKATFPPSLPSITSFLLRIAICEAKAQRYMSSAMLWLLPAVHLCCLRIAWRCRWRLRLHLWLCLLTLTSKPGLMMCWPNAILNDAICCCSCLRELPPVAAIPSFFFDQLLGYLQLPQPRVLPIQLVNKKSKFAVKVASETNCIQYCWVASMWVFSACSSNCWICKSSLRVIKPLL